MTAAARMHSDRVMRREYRELSTGQLQNLAARDLRCCDITREFPMCVRCRQQDAAIAVLYSRRYDEGAARLRVRKAA